MFDLTFLGTSASVPSAERNHPSILVEAGSHRILVDCGEGTQRQLLRCGAGFRRLDRLLLTHDHFDHVLGIPGLFSTLRLRQSAEIMTIHGSPSTLDVVVRMLAGLWGEGRAPIRWSSCRWRKVGSWMPANSRSNASRSAIATPTVLVSPFKARYAAIFVQSAFRRSACRMVPCARNWRKEGR
jgi:ribonuclease BN (tRNA processing enzyme)